MLCRKCKNLMNFHVEGLDSSEYHKCLLFGEIQNAGLPDINDNHIKKCNKFRQKSEINEEFVKLEKNHFLFKNKEYATSFAKKNIEPNLDIKMKLSDLFIYVQSREISIIEGSGIIEPSYYYRKLEFLEKLENRIRSARRYKDKKQKEDKRERQDYIMDLLKNKYFLKPGTFLEESTAIADVLKSISEKSKKKEIPWSRGKFLLNKYLKGCSAKGICSWRRKLCNVL